MVAALSAGRAGAAALTIGLVLAWSPGTAPAKAAVPAAFFGVAPQEALAPSDYAQMEGVVGTLRIPVYWDQLEPRPGEYDFSTLDETVAEATARGIQLLPYVYGTPSWLAANPARPPLGATGLAAWQGFLAELVHRYGPDGEFWAGRPDPVPIRRWQIWNEPNFLLFWRPRPSPSGYVNLLRASAGAIRAVDPGAQIVAAGLAPVGAGILPPLFLERMYAVRGAHRYFDAVALHPYATTPFGVAYYVRRTRRAMARAGDGGKPLLITELGVASAAERPTAFDEGPAGQAEFLRQAFTLLLERRHRWHIAGVDWFTWRDAPTFDEHCSFCQYAGLFDLAGRPKPAWQAFQQVVASAVR